MSMLTPADAVFPAKPGFTPSPLAPRPAGRVRHRASRLPPPLLMLLLSPRLLTGGALPVVLAQALFMGNAAAAGAVETGPTEEELLDRGIALRERRDDAAALDAFRRAYALKKGARALAQVALAEQALGRWVEAEVDLGQAISRTDDPWIARNDALLRQALAEIQGHLGTLQLTGGVPGAQVFVNGVGVGTLPLAKPLRVNAGTATVEVRATNYLLDTRSVIIPRRGVAHETVALVAAAPAQAPSAPLAGGEADVHPAWPVRRKVGLAFGAAAVVSAVVGTTFLFVRDSRAGDFNDAGCGTAALTPPCSALRDNEKSAVTWAVTGMLGAAVLGGVSAYLLFWPSGQAATRVARGESATGPVRCSPSSTADGMSLTCGGRF